MTDHTGKIPSYFDEDIKHYHALPEHKEKGKINFSNYFQNVSDKIPLPSLWPVVGYLTDTHWQQRTERVGNTDSESLSSCDERLLAITDFSQVHIHFQKNVLQNNIQLKICYLSGGETENYMTMACNSDPLCKMKWSTEPWISHRNNLTIVQHKRIGKKPQYKNKKQERKLKHNTNTVIMNIPAWFEGQMEVMWRSSVHRSLKI